MKVSKKILEVDQAVQTLIIGLTICLILFAIISPSLLIYYLLLQMAMVIWQVCSAFFIAIISGNQKRLQYLVTVFAFLMNAGLISYFLKDYVFESEIAMGIIWVVVPLIFTAWYFKITRDDIKALKKSEMGENISDPQEFV
jgi:hypothetical protein